MVHGIYRPWMRPQRPMLMNKTVIVNQQSHCHHSGGSGFWGGFLGGILGGGLFSQGGLLNGLFGFGGMPMMGGGQMFSAMPGVGGYSNPYAYLNQNQGQQPATPENTKDLSVLQKFYGDNYIIEERDGRYYAKEKEGDGVIEGESFEDMLDKLGSTTTVAGDPNTEELAEIKRLSQQLQEKSDQIEDLQSEIEALRKQGGSQTTTTTTTTGTTGGSDTSAGAEDGSKILWRRISDPSKPSLSTMKYDEYKTASDVLEGLQQQYNIKITSDTLLEELIKYNPSVFDEEGNVKADADWSKLDLPDTKWMLDNKYAEQGEITPSTDFTLLQKDYKAFTGKYSLQVNVNGKTYTASSNFQMSDKTGYQAAMNKLQEQIQKDIPDFDINQYINIDSLIEE